MNIDGTQIAPLRGAAAESTGYSVLILTRNEAVNISRCLDSLQACDDIVVLDSYSSDATLQVCERYPVRTFERQFDTFAGQRNWAIDTVPFRHPWVLHLDADECMTPALHHELLDVVARDEKSAYLLANKLMFMDRWIRHASMYPYYQARLLRIGESRFVQTGHGQTLGPTARGVGTLREPYLHYNFSKGISDWLSRHNRYSSDEAKRIASLRMPWSRALVSAFRGATRQERQQSRKRLADSLPARPLWRFLYLYFLRRGFWDGGPGFHYCMLMAIYDYLIVLKTKEVRSQE
ncbi:MAG: glycosyltransferase family 2 protein [Pirellulales bacterium]